MMILSISNFPLAPFPSSFVADMLVAKSGVRVLKERDKE